MINESFWNRKRLNSQLDNDDKIIHWAKHIGLLPTTRFCNGRRPNIHAKCEMTCYPDRKPHGSFKCTKCHMEKSIAKDTWFEEARLPYEKILR